MATKRQAVAALRKLAPLAQLDDVSIDNDYGVQITAPTGHHWNGAGVHSVCFGWYGCGNKPEFWDDVVDEITNHIGEPEVCDEYGCCEWNDYGRGKRCEFWDDVAGDV